MRVDSLELHDFRNWIQGELQFAPQGLIFVVGENAQGKTNLLEAIYLLCRNKSFRTTEKKSLVHLGTMEAIVRGNLSTQGRELLVEAAISLQGRDKFLVNRKSPKRFSELERLFPVVTFQPEDLEIVKGGPSLRRSYVDETLTAISSKMGEAMETLERVLRQRNLLLKQAEGRAGAEILSTLDVWDVKLAEVGEFIANAREEIVSSLGGFVETAYFGVALDDKPISLNYLRSWEGPLYDALGNARKEDIRRQMSTIGPHRDDVSIEIGEMPARLGASQGEQRTMAYSLKLAMARFIQSQVGDSPLVLLDDIVSELDDGRAERLFENLPPGQIVVSGTTLPQSLTPRQIIKVHNGSTLEG